MRIRPSSAGATAADYARELLARAALKQAKEARKSDVAASAAKVRSGAAFGASETRKQHAKARLQQVREWLQIVRKLYAQNPKAMAKALAQVFKDLKAAVQAYKDAGGQEMGAAGAAVGAVLSSSSRPQAQTTSDEDDPGSGGPPAATDAATVATEGGGSTGESVAAGGAALAAAEGRSIYDAVVSEVRKQVGEDGLEFLKDVRGMVDDIKKLLQTARGQAAIRKRDKETDTVFEDADKALKDLHKAMADMDREIRADAPAAGLRLSIAA